MHHPGQDQRVGDVALFARRSQQLDADRGDLAMTETAARCPWDSERVRLEPRAGHHERLAGQAGPQRLEGGGGQGRDVAEGLVTDLAPGANAAAQQVRDRLAVLAVLRLILAHDSGDVDRTILPCHSNNPTTSSPRCHLLSWLHLPTPKKPSVLLRGRIRGSRDLNFGLDRPPAPSD